MVQVDRDVFKCSKKTNKKKHWPKTLMDCWRSLHKPETFIFVDFPGPPGFLPTKFDKQKIIRNWNHSNDPNDPQHRPDLCRTNFWVPRLRAPTWPRGARPPPPPRPDAAAPAWPQPLGNPGAAPRDLVANRKKNKWIRPEKMPQITQETFGMSFGML